MTRTTPLPIVKKEPPRRSARCGEAPPAQLLTGIAQFNRGEYWDCHETLEELWRVEPDHLRYLYQGILQVGVGLYHLRRGNYRGAVNKLTSGLAYLAPSEPACLGVDVARLRAEAGAILARLRALGPERLGELAATPLPKVWLLDFTDSGYAIGGATMAARFQVDGATVELVQGDIVAQEVDAIVNAANAALLGGGGVDGAIHRAAGPELLAECRTLGGCPTGEARLTRGYHLPARYVIHAVGPVYRGQPDDARLLASAYRASLELAARHGLRAIAFPSLSTGAYGYPLDEAAPVALTAVRDALRERPGIALARFVLWGDRAYAAYERAARAIFGAARDTTGS